MGLELFIGDAWRNSSTFASVSRVGARGGGTCFMSCRCFFFSVSKFGSGCGLKV